MTDRTIRVCVWVAVALVAAFAFGQSYEHIYDLGRLHAQHGWTARLLPLSVDLLIVAAGLILWLQKAASDKPAGLARFMPRLMLWAGIGATIGANLAYGLPYGAETALISTWPGAMFAGLAETVMVSVRPVQREAVKRTVIAAGQSLVPATVMDAARVAHAASVAAGNPLSSYQIHKRFSIPRSQADKICRTAALNGDGPHG